MARTPKLKVYRTPIGFHDAYVAAPSKKAAMEAWGADIRLFARGEAEEVTDPALTAEPLAKPGTVVKRLRGTVAEQIEALGDEPQSRPPSRPVAKASRQKPKPKPSRAALDEAEAALADALDRQRTEVEALRAREAELAREREELERLHADEARRLRSAQETAEQRYDEAIRRWRG